VTHYPCCGATGVDGPAALPGVAHAVRLSARTVRSAPGPGRPGDDPVVLREIRRFRTTLLIKGVVIAAVGVAWSSRRASRWVPAPVLAQIIAWYLMDYRANRVITAREGRRQLVRGKRQAVTAEHDAAAATRRSSLGCGCCLPVLVVVAGAVLGVIRYPDLPDHCGAFRTRRRANRFAPNRSAACSRSCSSRPA